MDAKYRFEIYSISILGYNLQSHIELQAGNYEDRRPRPDLDALVHLQKLLHTL